MSFGNFDELKDVLKSSEDSDKLENLAFLKKGNEAEYLAKLKDEGMYVIDDKKPNVKDTVKEERMARENEAKAETKEKTR